MGRLGGGGCSRWMVVVVVMAVCVERRRGTGCVCGQQAAALHPPHICSSLSSCALEMPCPRAAHHTYVEAQHHSHDPDVSLPAAHVLCAPHTLPAPPSHTPVVVAPLLPHFHPDPQHHSHYITLSSPHSHYYHTYITLYSFCAHSRGGGPPHRQNLHHPVHQLHSSKSPYHTPDQQQSRPKQIPIPIPNLTSLTLFSLTPHTPAEVGPQWPRLHHPAPQLHS